MKNKLLFAFAFLGILSFQSCKLDDETADIRETYFFNQGITLDPFKTEYSEGDIFWMEVRIPDKVLQDLETSKDIFVSNAKFNVAINTEVVEFDPLPQSPVRFDISMQNGTLFKEADFENTANATLFFGCPDNTYILRAGLQLKEVGNYMLFLNQEQGASLITFTGDSDCSLQDIFPPPAEADLGYVQFTFDVEDTNLDVFNSLVGSETSPLLDSYREALENKTAFFISVR
ncbi:MAG: hypothetical protein KDD01_00200 [Phaeodactylibacter sp.]|nr:hypothetical protein [Phaeodactylibacter sp.]